MSPSDSSSNHWTKALAACGLAASLVGVLATPAFARPKEPDQILNDHPSGRDRYESSGGSGTQGKAGSDPDGGANNGPDKPGGIGGFDADKDGNNGCGNDDDFEDDNNGACRKVRPALSTSATPARPRGPVVNNGSGPVGDRVLERPTGGATETERLLRDVLGRGQTAASAASAGPAGQGGLQGDVSGQGHTIATLARLIAGISGPGRAVAQGALTGTTMSPASVVRGAAEGGFGPARLAVERSALGTALAGVTLPKDALTQGAGAGGSDASRAATGVTLPSAQPNGPSTAPDPRAPSRRAMAGTLVPGQPEVPGAGNEAPAANGSSAQGSVAPLSTGPGIVSAGSFTSAQADDLSAALDRPAVGRTAMAGTLVPDQPGLPGAGNEALVANESSAQGSVAPSSTGPASASGTRSSGNGASLPVTGSNSLMLVVLGAALLLAGVPLTAASRKARVPA